MIDCKSEQKGFTLIELMITIVIFAILVAIAIPTYRQYMIRNAESQARAQMGQLEVDLQSWRATMLSYRGFTPKNGEIDSNGNPKFGYADSANTVIYVPIGSNSTNYRYQINLFDGDNTSESLKSGDSDEISTIGRSWVMIAEPNPNGIAGTNGKVYLQHSSGLRCSTPAYNKSNLPVTLTDCNDVGLEKW